MKYFKQPDNDNTEIVFEKIFSIKKDEKEVIFMEDCDQWFYEEMSKEDAIELLQEAIDWINS